MRIAIVHDWLNQKIGGAESVLFELAKLYPDADIYTLIYNSKKFDKHLKNRHVIVSRLQAYPSIMHKKPQTLLPFIKRAVEEWDFSSYDLVISSSTAWVKNINIPKSVRHISYCHSPARMLWDSWPKYLEQHKLGPLRRYYVTKLASKLRLWDYYRSQENIEFVANSKYVSNRIAKFYKQPSKVIYPPVAVNSLKPKATLKKKDYYLIVSVIAPYKNIELAVRAFMQSGKQLVVAGDGADLERLKLLAHDSSNIQFTGRVDEAKKRELLLYARGFVFCSIEDFGITMVESIAAGTPVIALKGGGAEEIIHEDITGMFFDEPNESSLNKVIDQFEKTFSLNHKLLNKYVFTKFSSDSFDNAIAREVVR